MTIYILYWIHHINESNPFSDGYIGVTKSLYNRLEYHRKSKYPVGKAIRKYGENIKCDILYSNLSQCDAFELESKYRPKQKIGWNLAEGGNGGVGSLIPNLDTKHKMSKSQKKRYIENGNSTIGQKREKASPERILKMKETWRKKYESGYVNNRKGVAMSDEQKQKISKSRQK